jgi:DNA oxidative demethylase
VFKKSHEDLACKNASIASQQSALACAKDSSTTKPWQPAMDLFESADREVREELLLPGASVLRNFALSRADSLMAAIEGVLREAPLRNMSTPGGLTMSVEMSNCGVLGWVSDRRGYRYSRLDPLSGRPWPKLPEAFASLAAEAAARAGFAGFKADACLINRYCPGARMGLHQDRDEQDFEAPIVSLSLGLPAIFLFGGGKRSEKSLSVPLAHGDVVVWGGPARQNFHGVRPLMVGEHSLTGPYRFNLTLRKAGA